MASVSAQRQPEADCADGEGDGADAAGGDAAVLEDLVGSGAWVPSGGAAAR